jgi:6,7-dimethyl-8-ribityllumazine synthase
MSTNFPEQVAKEIPPHAKIAIAAARFNEKVVEALLSGCLKRLKELGIDQTRIEVHHVPGAFELPLAAKVLVGRGRFAAVICLGAVIRGETPHFDFVAGEAARGIQSVALSEKFPVIFGVLTTNNEEQAMDRCGGKHGHAGERAAEAAVEMIYMIRRAEAKHYSPT